MTAPLPLARLRDALNTHDPKQVAAAFTDDYVCEMPLHPSRGFTGSTHVQQTYEQIFANIPDLGAEVVRWVEDGDTTWSEWEMSGTGPGGAPAVMRGVVIADAPGGGPIAHTRFYLDPVTDGPPEPA